MKKAASAEISVVGSCRGSSRREPAGASDLTIAATNVRAARSGVWIAGCALASVLAIVVAYYFAFGAAHAAQIKDVPLATKGGRP